MPLPVLTTASVLDQPASGARTPTDQRLAKFRAVINDPVACIEFLRNDVWCVSGACWRVDIAFVGTPSQPGLVGPREFELRTLDRTCS